VRLPETGWKECVCMQADTIFVLALIVLSIGAILWMRRQSSK
jgi:hypothetical protein